MQSSQNLAVPLLAMHWAIHQPKIHETMLLSTRDNSFTHGLTLSVIPYNAATSDLTAPYFKLWLDQCDDPCRSA
jgi:hypothetical protein